MYNVLQVYRLFCSPIFITDMDRGLKGYCCELAMPLLKWRFTSIGIFKDPLRKGKCKEAKFREGGT